MPESLNLVVKVSTRAKKVPKKPQVGPITRFPKKNLSWLIWNISIAKIWWKKIWCHYINLGVIFPHSVKLTGHFQSY